jgi:rSAM/selenodomain-associated transferase 2
MTLSIIMPVLDEAAGIEATLAALAPYRSRGCELIVVDGGSRDGTLALASPLAENVLSTPRGRAAQMNAGAAVAHGDVFLFLHADTKLPANADALIRDALAHSGRAWGRFDVRFDHDGIMPLIAIMMNLRSRLTGIATGDQAIFVTRAAFDAIGGFPAQPLMEDIALSSRIRRISSPAYIRAPVTTSARRWRKQGILRTVFLMWRLRLAYFLGADPARLARQYGYADR